MRIVVGRDRYDVLTRLQNLDCLGVHDVLVERGHPRVEHDVRVTAEHLLLVARHPEAEMVPPDVLADVDPVLAEAVAKDSDELEFGTPVHDLESRLADVAG